VLESDGEFGGILWPAGIILKFRIIVKDPLTHKNSQSGIKDKKNEK
jgi:hypothetical protein